MNYIVGIIILLLFAACSATVDDNNRNSASFEVYSIEAISSESIPFNLSWKDIPRSKTVSMKACLKDSALLEAIPGLTFVISGNSQEYRAITDATGCLYWNEDISFNFLEQERDIPQIKIFRGPKQYQGQIEIPISINPWKEGVQILKDLRKQKIISQTKIAGELQANLLFDTLNLSFTNEVHSNNKMQIAMQLLLYPEIKRVGINGNLIPLKLTSGKFQVTVDLIEKQNQTEAIATIASTQALSEIKNGVLTFDLDFIINQIPHDSSNLQLALRLTPQLAPKGLNPLEGIFHLTDFNGNKTLSLIHLEQSLSEYKSHNRLEKKDQIEDFGFIIDEIAIEKGAYYHPTYTDDPVRRLQIKYTACLRNAFTKKSIKEHPFFAALVPKDSEIQLQLRPIGLTLNGCFTTTSVIEFHQYDVEHWMKFDIVVSSNQAPFQNILRKRRVYINPWGNSETFAFDSREGAPPNNPDGRRPEIFVDEVGYRFRKNTNDGYELDKFLQLQLTKEFEVYFEPKVKQFHSFTGDVIYSPLNSGKFELEVYLLAITNGKIDYQNLNIDDYSLMAKTIVTDDVENGKISAHIKLKMSFIDLPQLLARNLLVIKVSPTNPKSKLFPTIVTVPFDFKDHSFNVLSKGFAETKEELPWTKQQNMEQINKISSKLNALTRRDDLSIIPDISPLTLFRQRISASNKINRNNPRLILNINSQERIKHTYNLEIPVNWLDDLLQTNNLHKFNDLCALFYPKEKRGFFDLLFNPSNKTNYERCLAHPFDALSIIPTTHVNKIISSPFKEHASPGIMIRSHVNGISMNFSREKTNGTRKSVGLNAGIGFDVFGKLGFKGVKAGGTVAYDWFWSETNNESIANNTTITESRSSYLFYNHLELSFEANVTQCALINAKRMEYVYIYPSFSVGGSAAIPLMETRYIDSPEVFHVCQDHSKIESLTEDWYFIGEYWKGQSVLADGMETKENPLTQLVRGKKNFEEYRVQVDQANKEMILLEVDPELISDHYKQLYKYGEIPVPFGLFKDNAFPGFINK